MLLLISPAKTLDFTKTAFKTYTEPRLLEESNSLIGIMKKKSSKQIQKLMSVSEKIAQLNYDRYQSFETPFNLNNAKQAIFAFKGDVYTGLEAESLDKNDLKFAQKHLRILSGLYGVLKPMDLMQPYRLEMGIKLSNGFGKNLYQFWDNKITELINEDVKANKEKVIINLASKEYYGALKPKSLIVPVIHIQFKEKRNDVYKIISFSAKKARGMMSQYVIKNRLTKTEDLKAFNMERYKFNQSLSTDTTYTFTRKFIPVS